MIPRLPRPHTFRLYRKVIAQVDAIKARAEYEAATWAAAFARGAEYQPRLFHPGCPLFPLDIERMAR